MNKHKEYKDKFISLFQRLERYLNIESRKFSFTSYSKAIEESENKVIGYHGNLRTLRLAGNLRNIIVHNKKDIAFPTKEFVDEFEILVEKITNPKRLFDVMVKKEKINYCSLLDPITKALEIMKRKRFTTIPIIEEGLVVGVFTESTIFSNFLSSDGELIADLSKTFFKDIVKETNIEQQISLRYLFISKDTNVYDAREIFLSEYKEDKKLELMFVTHNGKKTQKILGLVTIYDLLGL